MKILITAMLMTSLVSCATGCKRVKQALVCAQVKQAIIKPLPFYDVSFKFDRCRARCFSMGNWENRPVDQCSELKGMNYETVTTESGKRVQVVDFPIEHCEGVSGPVAEDWAREIKPKMRSLVRMRGTYCE